MIRPDLPPSTASTAWVDARYFSLHVRSLVHECRVPWRVVALLAHVPSQTVRRLAGQGDRPLSRIRVIDAMRILTVSVDDVEATRDRIVPAGSTQARTLALRNSGCGVEDIADMLDVTIPQAHRLLNGEADVCTEMTRLRARAACEARGLVSTAEPITTS
ncbi:hypothetical protein O6R08_03290 [Cutibacterium equinum]|uniref:XRE family transcriptional regulator n=1 Tax=Cutibacterium equinum TaxID=3016342 RepID=A0ABY7QZS2_9ACTN|nr:hypothetical protein [Cutibacterium equinum]WCC80545.1 hypothetical protein O6R08_03290 [Cutibacterium equinum]